jgi:hypothetical protein
VEVLLHEFDKPDFKFYGGSVTGIDTSTDGCVSYVILLDDFELISGIPETQMRLRMHARMRAGAPKANSNQLEVCGSRHKGKATHQLIDLVNAAEEGPGESQKTETETQKWLKRWQRKAEKDPVVTCKNKNTKQKMMPQYNVGV